MPTADELLAQAERNSVAFENRMRVYEDQLAAYESCAGTGAQCAAPPAVPEPLGVLDNIQVQAIQGATAAAPVITITPQQAAYTAVARLTLRPPTPGIGPPPSINKWKMAAVGYPLWLWAEGSTDPGAVSDAVGGLSVRLEPRLDRLVFRMGDGKSTTCEGAGTKWTPSTTPGAESPTCGYRYEKPSLPKGNYTVTAQTRWMVDWTINGVSGSIPIVQEASTELPVGELQALVR